jgi:hypothetical protein
LVYPPALVNAIADNVYMPCSEYLVVQRRQGVDVSMHAKPI